MRTSPHIQSRISEDAYTFTVYRTDDNGAYTDSFTEVGQSDILVLDASGSQLAALEGVGQDVSTVGLAIPEDSETVQPNDQLRRGENESRRYDVETKVGIPNEFEPVVYQFGLRRANASE